ncbi:MAG: hypothetical protein NMNS01_28600 [Nitrosomonas sp.]|jgi:Protein of unknown function (DUF2934)|nr:MAG: hypothetical protein NMNS01_28600 [Nitrosomonas sp.]
MESVKLQAKSTKKAKSTSNPKSAKRNLSVIGSPSDAAQNEKERNARIALSAYYKAQARGFKPGYELADWLAAEAEESQ